jgi:carboxylesterase
MSLRQKDTGVLLFHGFAGSCAALADWSVALSQEVAEVAAPALPGHTGTWSDLANVTASDWFSFVEQHVTQMSSRHRYVIVGGLSFGGALALTAAARFPDVVKAVLVINPAVFPTLTQRVGVRVLSLFRGSVPSPQPDVAKPGPWRSAYPRIPLSAVGVLPEVWTQIRSEISDVRAPVQVFTSVQDHVVPPSDSDWICSSVSSGTVSHVMLRDSFHMATYDYDAGLINDRSTRFISRLRP